MYKTLYSTRAARYSAAQMFNSRGEMFVYVPANYTSIELELV